MPASELPGQLGVAATFGVVALAGSSYLVYPRERHDTFGVEPGDISICLVVRNGSTALRATLRRLAGMSLPPHRLVIVDGGSDDWSLSDAIAHAAAHGNAIVYQSPRAATVGALYAAALEAVGSGTSVLAPLHPELARAALVLLPPALELADDILAAIPGAHARLLTGAAAAAIAAEEPPLMALRGPVDASSDLARCRTGAELAGELARVLGRGHCAVAELPAIAGWVPAAAPPKTERTLTTTFWPGEPPLRLGREGAFTFLVVTPWNRDTGWRQVVEAYVRAFTSTDPVSLAIVLVGPEVPPEDEAGAEVLAVIGSAHAGDEEDVPDISLHTTPSVSARLPAIYTGSDCFIVTGQARSAIEAMASGLPVIERFADAAELAAAMTAAAADPAGAATRGAEARRRAIQLSAVDEQALDRPEQPL